MVQLLVAGIMFKACIYSSNLNKGLVKLQPSEAALEVNILNIPVT